MYDNFFSLYVYNNVNSKHKKNQKVLLPTGKKIIKLTGSQAGQSQRLEYISQWKVDKCYIIQQYNYYNVVLVSHVFGYPINIIMF